MTEIIYTDLGLQWDGFFIRGSRICLSLRDALTNVSSLHVLVYIKPIYTYSNAEFGLTNEAC